MVHFYSLIFASLLNNTGNQQDMTYRETPFSRLPANFPNTRLLFQIANGEPTSVDFNQVLAYISSQTPAAVTEVTVAEAQALITASDLVPGTLYLVTNALSNTAQIILMAVADNAFGVRGWREGYVFFDYYLTAGTEDGAGYMDADQNYVDEMSSGLGTAISTDGVYNNQILASGATLDGAIDADFTNNRISNSTFTATAAGTTRQIDGNYFNGGTIVVGSDGDLRNFWVNCGLTQTVTLTQAADMENCVIDARVEDLTFGSANTYDGKTYKPGYSDFDISYAISSTTEVDLDGLAYVGIVNLTSTDPTETIDTISNWPLNHPVRLYPEAGLIVGFLHGTGANQPHLLGSQDYYCDGDDGDYIELTNIGGVIYQTGGSQFSEKTFVAVGAAPVAATTATFAEVVNITLPAGEWDVFGEVSFETGGAGATIQQFASDILAGVTSHFAIQNEDLTLGATISQINPTQTIHVSLAAPTLISLQASVTFSAGDVNMTGTIRATRTTS